MKMNFFFIFIFLVNVSRVLGSSDKKPHHHSGILESYDGKPLPIQLNKDQVCKLDKGEPIIYNERSGKSGRGVVIQDVNAPTEICMAKIRDLSNYPKFVPHVKKVQIYDSNTFANGTTQCGAKFDIGLMGFNVGYYLLLTHEPKFNTLTWTLDYKKNSDFDDSVGHWQVQPHPSKVGWTRILYSTKIKLFGWVPEFIMNFLTSKALTESTDWVKKESEKEAKMVQLKPSLETAKVTSSSWFNIKGGSISSMHRLVNSKRILPSLCLGIFKRF